MPNERRWPVYVVRRADGSWTPRRKLDWGHPGASRIYGSNCSQRVTLPDGDVLVPVTYASYSREDRVVGTLLCSFDGERLTVKKTGNYLELDVKRGLLEPSITFFEGRFYLTIRAEDDRGYVSASDDGLIWGPIEPWRFDDGEPLTMSTTQQHWLEHSDGLFLVYTRRREDNADVIRWRTPLLAARVEPGSMRLVRETETVVFPMGEVDRANPTQAALLGNFHVVHASPEESLITVGENRSRDGFRGDTLQARVVWERPNRLVA